jgi:S-adenosylmethionine synthetase
MGQYRFTSESVTEGHPDKVCDKIADSVLDDILAHDPAGRVACEVAANTGMVLVMGEITTSHYVNIAEITRRCLTDIGYANSHGFNADSCSVLVSIDEQSPDIAAGVGLSLEARGGSDDPLDQLGAGDQGLMFGFACSETEPYAQKAFMPLPIHLAHALAYRLAGVRRAGLVPGLMPDGKTQVTLLYEGFKPVAIDTVLISTQHLESVSQRELKDGLFEHVVKPVLPPELCPEGDAALIEFICNPSGQFIKGGPEADSGLSGRKLIVDTYGGMARHGGGSFSGKDPSKVDRGAAYYARYAAKNLVAAGVAERLELQVSYAIGCARPVGVMVETFGTEKVAVDDVLALLENNEVFDCRPQAIIQQLDLLRPRYAQVAAYGHFGRVDIDLPWERLNRVEAVRQALSL